MKFKLFDKHQLKNLLSDIRFWIIFFFLLRLIGITNAPLEISHNWRQSLTNMISRNFVENGLNLLYPMIDMAGEKTGIIGSEFPFFNFLSYLFSSIYGDSHWYGRLINLIISSFGLYYFYLLIKGILNKTIAFNSTLILTVSIWFAFSRKIMPDTFSVSLVIIGLYYAFNYLKYNKISSIFLFFLFNTLGILCKIPALSLFSVLGILFFIEEIPTRRKLLVFIIGTVSFIIICLWYFYWVPYLLETYHYQLYFPKGIWEGLHEIQNFIPELLEKFYFSSLSSYLATAFCLAGLILMIKNKKQYIILGLTIISLVFVVFIIKTGSVFPLHNYYVIPFTPVMALLAGYFISCIPKKFQVYLLILISVESIANQQHDFTIKDSKKYKLELSEITKAYIPKNNLVIINGGFSPQDIYFSHRKGWTLNSLDIANPSFIDSLATLGGKFIIQDRHYLNQQLPNYKQLFNNEDYIIYKIND